MQVQDESAGMVVALLDPQPGERVLDACAAPGGKALFVAAKMQGQVIFLQRWHHWICRASQTFLGLVWCAAL